MRVVPSYLDYSIHIHGLCEIGVHKFQFNINSVFRSHPNKVLMPMVYSIAVFVDVVDGVLKAQVLE